MKHLLITQPYLPKYRVPLFEAIGAKLVANGVSTTVAIGTPAGQQASRGDSEQASWSVPMRAWKIKLGQRTVEWRRVPKSIGRPDVIVSELQATNTYAWAAVARRIPLVLWGHGKSYVDAPSALGDKLEWALGRHARMLMTYTEGGRDYLVDRGRFAADRVVAIGNSTDTVTIRNGYLRARGIESNNDAEIGPRALYVGGLDASKRIDFLLEAAVAASELDPRFELVIAGTGALSGLVDRAVATGSPISRIEDVRGAALGMLGATTDALWMPGRVGLAAVDALAMGLPVHTTNFPYHAPELELLKSGEYSKLTDTPSGFAAESLGLISRSLPRHARVLREDVPTIDSVASNFVSTVLKALE